MGAKGAVGSREGIRGPQRISAALRTQVTSLACLPLLVPSLHVGQPPDQLLPLTYSPGSLAAEHPQGELVDTRLQESPNLEVPRLNANTGDSLSYKKAGGKSCRHHSSTVSALFPALISLHNGW